MCLTAIPFKITVHLNLPRNNYVILYMANAGVEQRHHLKYKLLRNSRETALYKASAPAHC